MMNSIAGVPQDFSATEKGRAIRSIGSSAAKVSALVDALLSTDYRVSQRIAGVLEAVGKEQPALLRPHLGRLVTQLDKKDLGTALKRNIPRILQWQQIPVNLQGRTVNACMRLLSDPEELVAAKVFSMTVLANIAKAQPDLKNEIRVHIESQYQLSTPAFRSRAKRVLKMLDR